MSLFLLYDFRVLAVYWSSQICIIFEHESKNLEYMYVLLSKCTLYYVTHRIRSYCPYFWAIRTAPAQVMFELQNNALLNLNNVLLNLNKAILPSKCKW
jgi:hypothetical protein